MLTLEVFTKGIMILTESLPPKPFTEPISDKTLEIWYTALSDLSNQEFEKAIVWLIRNAETRPVPAEIRKAARNVSENSRNGDEAWDDVINAIRTVGSYRIPSFNDPVTEKAVQALDWRSICQSSESDLPTIRAQFRNLYDNIKKNQRANIESTQVNAFIDNKVIELTASMTKKLSAKHGGICHVG